MPDSLLSPGGGLESFDERDLDDVLAGKTADLPDGLRPIADFLAALGAGPSPVELYGEATAMAEFRALGLDQVEHPAGQAATLLLEPPPGGQRAGRPSRRHGRHRTRPERRGALRPAVLLSAAAAAVIVLAVLVTGNLAGFFGNTTQVASPSAATSSAASTGHPAAPREETTSAAKEPTASPSATYSTTPAQSLASTTCWDYYSAYQNQGLSPWVTQQSLWELLTKLAGSKSRVKVGQFCAPYVTGLFPGGIPAANRNQSPAQNGQGDQNGDFVGQPKGGAAAGSRIGSGGDQSGTSQSGTSQSGTSQSGSSQGDVSGSGASS